MNVTHYDGHRLDAFHKALQANYEIIWENIGRLEASFDAGCLLWLTQYTALENHYDVAKGTPLVAPFPKEERFTDMLRSILSRTRLLISKSPEMMSSWLACGYIAWMCQWFPYTQWILQTGKKDRLVELVNYCRILYHRQQPWMADRVSIKEDKATKLVLSNGSNIFGLPKGVNQIRSYHPYGVFFDEAALLPDFETHYNIAHPVASQIIAVGSPAPGRFAEVFGI